jgi:hypothetical protein
MIRRMTTVGILISLVFLPWISTGAREVGGPVVFLKEDHIDFKEVLEGEVITHSFNVMNTGDEALKILRVKPG